MSKSKNQLLAQRKQRLVKEIEQQRLDLAISSRDWLQATAPYDRAWQTMVTFKPIFIAVTGLISIYTLKRPKQFFSLGKKAIATWSLVRTVQGAIKASNK
ncbi:YqjK-like family protein [Providencia sp. Je.9.19]|uniref:YqjK-like family protein n=1 Tax=unclassified Providencia TaxID=2633465 RepID=UPI003DA9492E